MPDESVDAFLGKVVAGDKALSSEAMAVVDQVRAKAIEKMKIKGIGEKILETDFLSLRCENTGKVRGMDLMRSPYLDEIREGRPKTELCISVKTSDEKGEDILEQYFFAPDGVTMQVIADEGQFIKAISPDGGMVIPEKRNESKDRTSYPDEPQLRRLLSNLSSTIPPRSSYR